MFQFRQPVIPEQSRRSMAEAAAKAQKAMREVLSRLGLKEAAEELRRKQR